MLNVFGLHAPELETFLLVFVPCTTIVSVLPVFFAAQIPIMVRVALGFVMSFVVFKTLPVVHPFTSLDQFAFAVLSQVVVGVMFGFVCQLVFVGVQFAGEIIDIQIGFAVANVINPQTQQQVTII